MQRKATDKSVLSRASYNYKAQSWLTAIRSNGKSTTPESKLPRGWARLRHETNAFLKSMGLGVISTTIRGLRKDFVEPKKIAVQQSRRAAALKSLIHLVPVGVATLEIVWNWRGRYIGYSFNQQNYYQFAAKAHEILMQASLSAIILSFILTGLAAKGLPFGAFLSSLQFTQISYLWSTELWSSIFANDFPIPRKLAFIVITISCGLIAAASGPSSATLLIPRQVLWALPPTQVFFNHTSQDIWPDHVTTGRISPDCAYMSEIPLGPACPAADFVEIRGLLVDSSSPAPAEPPVGPRRNTAVSAGEIWAVQSAGEPFNRFCALTTCPQQSTQLCATCAHDVIAKAAFHANSLWSDEFTMSFKSSFLDIVFDIDSQYFQPYSVANCLADTIESPGDQSPLRFPGLLPTSSGYDINAFNQSELLALPGSRKGSWFDTPGNNSEFRLSWISVPPNIFSGSTIGAILYHPREAANQIIQKVTACTFGAGWGTSALHSDFVDLSGFVSTVAGVPDSFQTLETNVLGTRQGVPYYTLGGDYVYPQKRTSISPEWAELLNPIVLSDRGNTSLINEYIAAVSMDTGDLMVSNILSVMLITGLSRIGADLTSEGNASRNS